jgi:hypothetical protein
VGFVWQSRPWIQKVLRTSLQPVRSRTQSEGCRTVSFRIQSERGELTDTEPGLRSALTIKPRSSVESLNRYERNEHRAHLAPKRTSLRATLGGSLEAFHQAASWRTGTKPLRVLAGDWIEPCLGIKRSGMPPSIFQGVQLPERLPRYATLRDHLLLDYPAAARLRRIVDAWVRADSPAFARRSVRICWGRAAAQARSRS